MKFDDEEIKALECTNINDIIRLIVEYLCGGQKQKKVSENDKKLVEKLIKKANKEGLNYEQFNEFLLLLNQNRVKRDFFNLFFGKRNISLNDVKRGIIKFRGFAMLCFGNFRFAYQDLINKSKKELLKKLNPYMEKKSKLQKKYTARPVKMLSIEKIKRDETWFTGELTGDIINKNLKLLKKWSPSKGKKVFLKFNKRIVKIGRKRKKIIDQALKNTDTFLTWDYMDVYFATSMRHKWEFEETFDFIEKLFGEPSLKKLNLRYFDPTQCKCTNPRDKGLIEGLMLKRASCTIYMAQESDTIGKDSELAAALAQGTPVIAYVPKIDPKEYSRKIKKYSLGFFKKRLLILKAEGIFDEPLCIKKLKKCDRNFKKTIESFLKGLDKYRKLQPFTLWFEKDNKNFKEKNKDFRKICNILAIAESYNFDVRADLFKGRHPLSMQIDLQTGVANGVLVVRNHRQCVKLLKKILTNDMEFITIHKKIRNYGFRTLKEKVSGSPFRIVTDYERLTNSFWNFFLDFK